MYIPSQFRIEELAEVQRAIECSRLASLVTNGKDGLLATPLPLFLAAEEGEHGTLYGHVARANPQWRTDATEAMAIFHGPDAYVSPGWYASKQETHRVVPTWNYIAVHAYGAIEFFEDANRLLDVVTRLTDLYEKNRPEPWQVSDAPERFVEAQLRGIVGVRLPISRLEGKKKMSQNRSEADRAGVIRGLSASEVANDIAVSKLIET